MTKEWKVKKNSEMIVYLLYLLLYTLPAALLTSARSFESAKYIIK